MDALVERGKLVGSRLSVIEVLATGGAISREAPDATAFPHRDARWLINIAGQWGSPQESDAEVAWVRESFATLEPHLSGGAYVKRHASRRVTSP